jgi:hypothetical protein
VSVTAIVLVPISMAASIALFVSLEVLRDSTSACGALAVFWHVAIVAMLRIEAIINMAAEFIGTVKPWADTNKGAAMKPLRTVVAIGGTAIRRVVIVTIGARRGDSNVDAQLGLCPGSACRNEDRSNSDQYKKRGLIHEFSS